MKHYRIDMTEKQVITPQNKSHMKTLKAVDTKITQVKGQIRKAQDNKRKASIRHCYLNIIFKDSNRNIVIR